MGEYVLNRIRKLERIHGTEAKPHMGVDDEFREAKNFTARVERVPGAWLLTLLRR